MAKMRVTQHSGRTHRNGKTYSTKHNDRNFNTPALNIDPEKTAFNIVWTWCGKFSEEITIDEAEQKYYEKFYSKQLEATNEKYIKSRHKERIVSMEKWRKQRIHSPEETIMQIGKLGNSPAVDLFYKCWLQYLDELEKWNMETGNHMHILNWALHQDELGAAHVHSRRIWDYYNPETKAMEIGQEKALESAGVQLPFPDKPISRTNNRKITFDKMSRTIWQNIAMENGLEIETIPLPKNETGKSLDQYINDQEEKRRLEEEKLKAMKQAEIEREEAFSLQEALSLAENERKEEALEEEEKRLQQLKESIEKETSELEKRKKEAAEKEAAIEIKETELKLKEEVLKNTQSDIEKETSELEERKKDAAEKEAAIEIKETELKLKEEVLKNTQSDIEKETSELEGKKKKAAEKEAGLNFRETVLNTREEKLKDAEAEIKSGKEFLKNESEKIREEKESLQTEKSVISMERQKVNREKIYLANDKRNLEDEKKDFENDKNKAIAELNTWKENQIKDIESKAAEERKILDQQAAEIQNIYDENQKAIKDFQPKLKKIEEWQAALDVYEGEEEKPETYIYNQFKKRQEGKIDLNGLFQSVKGCVSGFISKVKKSYEKTIQGLKRRLEGYDYTDEKGQSMHSFGSEEVQKMFIEEATPETLRKIADDMESEGVENYIELHRKKPRILERHFEYAREITRSLGNHY